MLKIILLVSVLVLVGCISTRDFTPYKDVNGIIRSEYKISTSNMAVSLPEGAVRQENGKLETSLEKARETMDRQDPKEMNDYLEGHNCDLDVLEAVNRI